MQSTEDVLRERIAHLEAERDALRSQTRVSTAHTGPRRRLRTALTAVLIVVALLLAPIAAIGTWARVQLVDTERFVDTFAPLVHEPAIQAFVSDQITSAIDESIDIDGLVGSVFEGVGTLGLPASAQSALGLLEAPAAQGMRSLLDSTVAQVIASDAFAQVWEGALRETHRQAVSLIQGDPNSTLQLTSDGTLALQLKSVLAEVKQALLDRGFALATVIPVIDLSIPLLSSESYMLLRTLYQVTVTSGYAMPWIVLGLLVAAVVSAPRRLLAMQWIGIGLTASFLLLGAALGVGREFFIYTVSPSIMPLATAQVAFDQVIAMMSSTIVALVAVSAALAVGSWFAGNSSTAQALRTLFERGFAVVRNAADRHGLGTGRVGRAFDRWRRTLAIAIVAVGALVLFLTRPPTLGSVVGTIVVVVVLLLLVELIRRPADAEPALAAAAPPEPVPSEPAPQESATSETATPQPAR